MTPLQRFHHRRSERFHRTLFPFLLIVAGMAAWAFYLTFSR
jgi:hypothetical protein